MWHNIFIGLTSSTLLLISGEQNISQHCIRRDRGERHDWAITRPVSFTLVKRCSSGPIQHYSYRAWIAFRKTVLESKPRSFPRQLQSKYISGVAEQLSSIKEIREQWAMRCNLGADGMQTHMVTAGTKKPVLKLSSLGSKYSVLIKRLPIKSCIYACQAKR